MASNKIVRALTSVKESEQASVTPSEYPVGIRVSITNNTYPGNGCGIVITTKFSDIRCSQVVIDYLGFIYARGAINGTTWSTWKKASMADVGGVISKLLLSGLPLGGRHEWEDNEKALAHHGTSRPQYGSVERLWSFAKKSQIIRAGSVWRTKSVHGAGRVLVWKLRCLGRSGLKFKPDRLFLPSEYLCNGYSCRTYLTMAKEVA